MLPREAARFRRRQLPTLVAPRVARRLIRGVDRIDRGEVVRAQRVLPREAARFRRRQLPTLVAPRVVRRLIHDADRIDRGGVARALRELPREAARFRRRQLPTLVAPRVARRLHVRLLLLIRGDFLRPMTKGFGERLQLHVIVVFPLRPLYCDAQGSKSSGFVKAFRVPDATPFRAKLLHRWWVRHPEQ